MWRVRDVEGEGNHQSCGRRNYCRSTIVRIITAGFAAPQSDPPQPGYKLQFLHTCSKYEGIAT